MTIRRIIMLCALGLAPGACIIDTVPLPEADKDLVAGGGAGGNRNDGDGLGIDSDALFYTSGPVVLVGAPNAVPAGGRVLVGNSVRADWEGSTDAATDGSFNMPVNAGIGDTLEVSLLFDGAVVDTLLLPLEPPSSASYAAQEDLDAGFDGNAAGDPSLGGIAVTGPDAQGNISVAGLSDAGFTVVVANLVGGSSAIGNTLADGSFNVSLAGNHGDELSLFVIVNGGTPSGAQPISVLVP